MGKSNGKPTESDHFCCETFLSNTDGKRRKPPLRRFLRALALGDGAWESVPSLAYRTTDGVRKTPVPPFIDLEKVPPLYANGARQAIPWGDRKMRFFPMEWLRNEFRAASRHARSIDLADADILMNRKRGR